MSHTRNLTSGETNLAVPDALILFMFMFSFVLALSASAIASPSISSEVESGVLMTIVTRPVRRTEVLLGKWLGLATLLAGYAAGVCALEFGVIRLVSGFTPPSPVLVGVYLFAEGALLLTLTLGLSTRVPMIAAGVIGIAVFGAGWLAGVVGTLGATLQHRDVANHRADRALPAAHRRAVARRHLLPATARRSLPSSWPKAGTAIPSSPREHRRLAYLLWVACWFVIVLGAGVISFERREL